MTWTTNLDAYAHYWGSALGMGRGRAKRRMREIREGVDGTWGSGDDPLGSMTPMSQDAILKRLGKLAAGRIDDWESLVDPELSAGENYQIVLENGGELPADEKEAVRQAIAETVDAREQSRAADIIRENAEAIEAGEQEQLAADIADAYGEDFVSETVRAALEDIETAQETPDDFGETAETDAEAADTADAPDVEAPETPTEPEPETDPETADADLVASAPETTTERPETADPTADAGVSASGNQEPGTSTRGSRARRFLSSLVAPVLVPFRQGQQQALGSDGQTTLTDY